MSEDITVCPQAATHGNPFKYCQCGWMEESTEPAPSAEELLEAGQEAKPLHPSVQHLLDLFAYDHLPVYLQRVSMPVSVLAHRMAHSLESGPEIVVGLRHLLDAKDCLVRQAVIDHKAKKESV